MREAVLSCETPVFLIHKIMMKRTFCLSLLLALSAGFALTQHPDNNVNEGAKLFAQSCSACHGDTGKGGRGSDLTSGQWKFGASDDELVSNIRNGIAGTQMPAIKLSETDARKVVAYLRRLSGSGAGKERNAAKGSAAAGLGLFFSAAQCSQCHSFNGRGGTLAADLTNLRAQQSVSKIEQLMRQPIRMIEARMKAGATVRGVLKGEDTFWLRLFDD